MSTPSVPFELVIFDCDGVLVDSEVITNRVFAEMLTGIGIPATLDFVFEHFVGRSMATCRRVVSEMLGGDTPPDFWEDYRVRSMAAMSRELRPVDGIGEALDQIEVPWCVASSGDYDKMRFTLGLTKLIARFDGKLFSTIEVAHGKPAPDLFLFAASRSGAIPDRCIVVEDSPAGVQAGVAARMTVVGYAAHSHAERLRDAGAHHIITDMRALPAIVRAGATPAHAHDTPPRPPAGPVSHRQGPPAS